MYRGYYAERWEELRRRANQEQDPFKLAQVLEQMSADAREAVLRDREELRRSMEPLMIRKLQQLRPKRAS